MKLIKNINSKRITLFNNNKKVLEIGFEADEFTFIFYTDEPIMITKELDEDFFKSLNGILDNKYTFPHEYSHQDKDVIVWFSDGYCNLEDEQERDLVNRMIMRRNGNVIYLSAINPFCERNNISKRFKLVAFSPSGNGFLARNSKTSTTFQDDIIMAFYCTLNQKVAKI